jgi:predicted nucleic acid-binding Zn ribbon protein
MRQRITDILIFVILVLILIFAVLFGLAYS